MEMTSSKNGIKTQDSPGEEEIVSDDPGGDNNADCYDEPELEEESEFDEEQALQEGLEDHPGHIDFCHRLATLLRERDQDLQALEILEQGAMSCLERGRLSNAIELMERVLRVRPGYSKAHLEIGKIHLQKGRDDQALESIEQAFDGFLDNEELDKCGDALELLDEIKPGSIISTIKRAELMAHRGEVEQALALFREGAEALENDGQRQDFLEVGERMLELDPTLGDIRAKVGETLIAEAHAFVNYGLFDKAVKALARAIKYDPNQVETYMTLARVLVKGGRRDDAVDMAILATHKVEGDAQKRELLLLVWELTGAHEQVENLAEEMDIDLDEDPGESWPFPDEAPQELGDEATSPVHCGDRFSEDTQEATREHGPIIGDSSMVNNLVSLLELSANTLQTRRLILCKQQETAPFAELVLSRGRIHLGVRVQGQFHMDEELEKRPAKLVEQAQIRSRVVWQSVEDGDAAESYETPVLAASEKSFFTEVTARALVEIAKQATQSELGTSFVESTDEQLSSMVSFSPTSLLKAAADSMVAPCKSRSVLIEEMSRFSEELWLMVRPGEGEGFLPLEHNRVSSASLEETLATIEVASKLAAQIAVFHQVDGPTSDFVGVSFVFSDGAWSALVGDESVVLARSSNNSIGSLLRLLRTETDGEQS